MRLSRIGRGAAVACLVLFCRASAARADEGACGLPAPRTTPVAEPAAIPDRAASPAEQDGCLAAAEAATSDGGGEAGDGRPTTPGDEPYTILVGPRREYDSAPPPPKLPNVPGADRAHAPGTVHGKTKAKEYKSAKQLEREQAAAARERRHELGKKALAHVAIVGPEGEANAKQWTLDDGDTVVDAGHAEYTTAYGLTNSVEGQVSALEVKQAAGPADLEVDALTAKAGAEIGIEGVGVGVGATLVEAGAELGPVAGSVGFGLAAEATVSLHRVHLKVGLGLQGSIDVDPLEAATDAWRAGKWLEQQLDGDEPEEAPGASAGIAGSLPLAR